MNGQQMTGQQMNGQRMIGRSISGRLRRLAALCAGSAALAFGAGLWYGSLAQPTQLVRPDAAVTAELFGDIQAGTGLPGAGPPGTLIGSPQYLIVSQDALLPGRGPSGVRYASLPALQQRGEYPLQLKTVVLFRTALTLGLLILAALLLLSSFLLGRRPVAKPTPLTPGGLP